VVQLIIQEFRDSGIEEYRNRGVQGLKKMD
jgi:hypothetical protein